MAEMPLVAILGVFDIVLKRKVEYFTQNSAESVRVGRCTVR